MFKKLVGIFCILAAFSPSVVSAQLDCCSTHGGNDYCDFKTNTLYCKDGTPSNACTCKAADTPTPTPSPTLLPTMAPSVSPTPVCPQFASYDATLTGCTCNNGYTVKDSACVTYQQYCWSKFGGNAVYDTNKKGCECTFGYAWNDTATSCISFDQLCNNKLGSKSYYNSENSSCNCYSGYGIQDNKCQPIPTQALATPQPTSQILITNTPTPSPTIPPHISPKPTTNLIPLTPTIVLRKILPDIKKYIALRNERQNEGFIQVLQHIWSFIVHLF